MLLPSRRKKIRFQIPPSDSELWAVGLVVTLWSQLETLLTSLARALTPKDLEKRAKFDATRAFAMRLDIIEALIQAHIAEAHRPQLKALIVRIRDAQQMRDRIVHGTWSGQIASDGDDLSALSTFNWAKPRKRYEWKLDFGRIFSTAGTIDQLCVELIESVYAGIQFPPDKIVMLDDALRQKLQQPDQS